MSSNKYPQPPEPSEPGSYDHLVVRTDDSGNRAAFRPRQILVRIEGDVEAGLAEVDSVVGKERADASRSRDTAWYRLRYDSDIDVVRAVRRLRARGIDAQPNHVYFTASRASAVRASPNMFAPNMFAPNMFAPNMFAPNMFAPNMFAPNMFAPNMFAPNMFAGGVGNGCCCGGCPPNPVEPVSTTIPMLAARPADPPATPASEVVDAPAVQVHVIDVLAIGDPADPDHLIGEYADGTEVVSTGGIDENGDGWADPAMGHGDFVASVVELNCGLPTTLWQAADPLGEIDDWHLADAMSEVDEQVGTSVERRVLNLSVAGYNLDDRPSDVLAERVEAMIGAGWVVVAAAGNNSSCRLAWPAALPGVIAVGAISDLAPAWFSNFGPWVDVSAPGVDVVARYPDLAAIDPALADRRVATVHRADPTQCTTLTVDDFATGWAQWSGTSFSAPLVAARLAARLQQTAPGVAEPTDEIADLGRAIDDAIRHVYDNHRTDWHPLYGRLIR